MEITNGTVSVSKTRKLTAKQLAMISRMDRYQKTKYLMALLGLAKERLFVPRTRTHGTDFLGIKPKNSILNKLARISDVTSGHSPEANDQGQWVGVEIECCIPVVEQIGEDSDGEPVFESEWDCRARLKRALKNANVRRVTVKTDGSIRPGEHAMGVEITVLFNLKNGESDLLKTCEVLRTFGAFVNRSCGLHVHIDQRGKTKRQVGVFAKSLGMALPILSTMVPESRRNGNSYCTLGVSKWRGSRYYAINKTAYFKFKTVEVRLHSGTCDPQKILNWIQIVKLIGDAGLTRRPSMQDLIDKVNMPERLIEYMERRISEFTADDSEPNHGDAA